MNRLLNILSMLLLFSTTFSNSVFAKEKLDKPKLRLYLSGDSSSYAGMVMVNQLWTRYIWNNPDVAGNEQTGDADLGLRRSRLIFYTYLMDKVFIYTQVGCDGVSFRNPGNPNVSLINAQTEYIFLKDKLHVGFGLNTWNGVSRYNNSKLLEFLLVDNPGFAYSTGGTFDRAGRQLGIYAKGTLSKLNYRVSVVRPFTPSVANNPYSDSKYRDSNKLALKGYFDWQFFDKENTLFPYMTMNNLGRSKLFNVGTGFYYHPEGMESNYGGGISENHDVFLAAVDVFLDMPLKNKSAITSYLGYYYYSFGPNYLRPAGKMNISTMSSDLAIAQGAGNSEWEIGTGNIVHGEIGYLLPKKVLNSRVQPYGAFTYKDFEALGEASVQYDFGVNFLVHAHNIKWTLQYSSRPIYGNFENGTKPVKEDSRGQLVLQTQVFF